VAFTVGLTLLAGLAIGSAPAIASTAARDTALQTRGGTATRRTARLRTLVVGAQIAVTVVLLIAATLTAASFARVLQVDPGFEIDGGLIADVRPPGSQGERIRFFDDLVARAQALPGVARACAINHVPLDNDGATMTFVPEGRPDASRQSALPMGVSDGCFDVLRIPVVGGRGFHRAETESVAIVNESMAAPMRSASASTSASRPDRSSPSSAWCATSAAPRSSRRSPGRSGCPRRAAGRCRSG
jgi:hypothetical protein